jgi:YD repeat-containing protein
MSRLLSVTTPSGNFSFSYDANGNTSAKVTSTGTWTYSYDPLNRLTGVQWNGVTQASYGYNGKGQRTSKTAGGVSSAYLWDGANLAQENRGGTYYLYSYLEMQPIALTSTGSSQALETDLVGTVLGVVNAFRNAESTNCERRGRRHSGQPTASLAPTSVRHRRPTEGIRSRGVGKETSHRGTAAIPARFGPAPSMMPRAGSLPRAPTAPFG